jgi:O-antigen/teichoic acid export membrane protein
VNRPPRSLAVLTKEVLLFIPSIGGPALVGIVGLILLTRLLSPSAYGHYALAYAVATTSAAVLSDWITPTFIRFEGETSTRSSDIIGNSFVLTCVMSMVGAIFAFASLVAVFPIALSLGAVALSLALPFYKISLAALRANLMTKRHSLLAVVISLIAFSTGLAGYYVTKDVSALLWGAALVHALALLPALRWTGFSVAELIEGIDRTKLGAMLAFGTPIIVTALGAQALLLADRYLLAALASPAAVGLYVPNYAIAERTMGFAFTPLFGALYPLAARAWAQGDRPKALEFIQLTQRLFLIFGGLAAILLVLMGDQLAQAMLGERFARGNAVIGLVALGNLIWFQGILFHQPLELDKRTKVISAQVLVAGAINIGLNLLLIPRYGLMGAAWATLLSYATYTVMAYIWSKKTVAAYLSLPYATILRLVFFFSFVAVVFDFVSPTGGASLLFAAATKCAYPFWLLVTRETLIAELG